MQHFKTERRGCRGPVLSLKKEKKKEIMQHINICCDWQTFRGWDGQGGLYVSFELPPSSPGSAAPISAAQSVRP